MASLRTVASAARFMRGVSPRIVPAARRFQSSNSNSQTELATADSTLNIKENAPDHNIPVDKATSYDPRGI